MKSYLFLLAWISGSDNSEEDTGVNSAADLLPEFKKGNENIFAVKVTTDKGEIVAENAGYRAAFFANYTGRDTVSDMVDWEKEYDRFMVRKLTI